MVTAENEPTLNHFPQQLDWIFKVLRSVLLFDVMRLVAEEEEVEEEYAFYAKLSSTLDFFKF